MLSGRPQALLGAFPVPRIEIVSDCAAGGGPPERDPPVAG